MPRILNLTVDQGVAFTKTLIALDADGTAMELAGFDVRGSFAKSFYSKTPVNAFTCEVGEDDGEIIISLTQFQTYQLSPDRYSYNVDIIELPDKNRIRIFEGVLTVNPGVRLPYISTPQTLTTKANIIP